MKIDLNFSLKGLDGEELKPAAANDILNVGKIISNHLTNVSKGDVLKHYEWAVKLNKGEPLELDKSDTAYLKKFIEENQNIIILIKAQALEKFNL